RPRPPGGPGTPLALIEAKRDETQVAFAFDQEEDRFSSGFFCFVDLIADLARALHFLLRSLHDHVAGTHASCSCRPVLADVHHDNPLGIPGEREFLLEIRRDARKRQAERLYNPSLLLGAFIGDFPGARLLLVALFEPADLNLDRALLALPPEGHGDG